MKLRSDYPVSEMDKGFNGNEDIFVHRDLGVRLTNLYRNLEHGTVALLDGRWGIGKTTFARRWIAHLKQNDIPAIYFDAFASDYIEKPFEAVAGALVQSAAEARRVDSPKYRNFLERAAKVGKVIAGTTAKIGVKAATLGIIGAAEIDQLGDVKEDIADALSEVSEKSIKKILEGHEDRQADFTALKHSLAQLPALLKPSGEVDVNGDADTQSLIVVIDELDRCRPDFALGVLETLKHFFRSDRIHFVLVTNRDHLALSVDHRYGTGIAANEYLEKFYDFVIYFDQNYGLHEPGNISAFVNYLANKLLDLRAEAARDIPTYVAATARAYQLSLRQIEAVFSNISLAYAVVRKGEFRPAMLVTFLVLIKTLRPDLYRKAKSGILRSGEVIEFLSGKEWGEINFGRIQLAFQYYLDPDINENDEKLRGYAGGLFQFNLERTRVIPYLANSVLDRFGRGQVDE